MFPDPSPTPTDEGMSCSSKGCRADAAWALLWNNPKIHTEDRRKTWLACEAHKDSLGDFLKARGFLRDIEPLSEKPVTGE